MKDALNPQQALVQLISDKIKDPDWQQDDKYVDQVYELALDVLVSDNKREQMIDVPKEKKVTVIKQAFNNYLPSNEKKKSPSYYVDLLNEGITKGSANKGRKGQIIDLFQRHLNIGTPSKHSISLKEILLELKIMCQSESMNWLKQFMECGGLSNLFGLLNSIHSKPGKRTKHYEIESETLKILRLIANHDSGITDILCQQDFLNILILSLDSPLLMARTATIDFLLAIVTLNYPTGHKLVMSAMEYFCKTRKKARVFDYLVESLASAVTSRGIFGSKVGAADLTIFGFTGAKDSFKNPSEKDIRDFLVSAVALVRFLVEIPPEFEYRMLLRHELISSGILRVFQKLSTWASSEFHDVLQHVVAFQNLKTADFQYLLTNMDSALDIDIDDPNQLLALLKSKLDENDTRTVSSLIQNIVVGTSLIDSETRSYMLSMIEKAVSFIVLDQNGITSFTDAFKYSVDQIICGLQEIEVLREENVQLSIICDHQERQLMEKRLTAETKPDFDSGNSEKLASNNFGIDLQKLALHKKNLDIILDAIKLRKNETQKEMERGISESTILEQSSALSLALPTSQTTPNPPPMPPISPMGPMAPPPPPFPAAPNAATAQRSFLKYRPTTKVRKLHWEKVPTFETSFWSQLNHSHGELEEKFHKAGLFAEIESAFQLKPQAVNAITKNKEDSVSKTALKNINILDEKRAQNVMIFLGTLRQISLQELVDSIHAFDVAKLNESILGQCKNCLPTIEEEKRLVGIDRNDNDFRKAEQFMLMMCEIYRYRSRVDLMIFKFGFSENFPLLKLQLFGFIEAFQSITKSKMFPKLLQSILLVGNYLNASTNSSINGFRASFLEKIVDLKGTNGVSSLHLISKLIIQSDPILYECVNDLAPLKTLKNSSLKALYDEISEVERQFKKIESEIDRIPAYESSPLHTPQDDLFIARIQQLYKDTTDKVQFLGVEQSLLKQEVAKVFRFFGEKETPDLTPEILIGYLIKFLSAFEVAFKFELEKIKKEKSCLPSASASKTISASASNSSSKPVQKKDGGKLENLLENLKSKPALAFDHSIPIQRAPRRFQKASIPPLNPNPPSISEKTLDNIPLVEISNTAWDLLDNFEKDVFKFDL